MDIYVHKKYNLITEGKNELTAKLTCNGNDIINSNGTSNIANEKSKWYSINITGIAVQAPIQKTQNQTQNQTQPSSAIQSQKIAILDDKELNTPSQEDAKSINDVVPEIESTAEDNEDLRLKSNPLQKLQKTNQRSWIISTRLVN